MSDKLKINILKYLALNITSLLEPQFALRKIPQYLIHDLEKFLKIRSVDKYSWQDMEELDSLPTESAVFSLTFFPPKS
jgi:hypothetical protein